MTEDVLQVEAAARRILDASEAEHSTTELIHLVAVQVPHLTLSTISGLLRTLARAGMADYASAGAPQPGKGFASGKMVTPLIWARPKDDVVGIAAMPADLARLLGCGDERPEPELMIDWALRWIARGVHVFPCRRFLGKPLIDAWHAGACCNADKVVQWWSQDPTADIGAVPSKSGHFVLVATGEIGNASLQTLEQRYGRLPAEFRHQNNFGDTHLWIKGTGIVTSHNRLGDGLHVIGAGHFLYLPPSWAPDHLWR